MLVKDSYSKHRERNRIIKEISSYLRRLISSQIVCSHGAVTSQGKIPSLKQWCMLLSSSYFEFHLSFILLERQSHSIAIEYRIGFFSHFLKA